MSSHSLNAAICSKFPTLEGVDYHISMFCIFPRFTLSCGLLTYFKVYNFGECISFCQHYIAHYHYIEFVVQLCTLARFSFCLPFGLSLFLQNTIYQCSTVTIQTICCVISCPSFIVICFVYLQLINSSWNKFRSIIILCIHQIYLRDCSISYLYIIKSSFYFNVPFMF